MFVRKFSQKTNFRKTLRKEFLKHFSQRINFKLPEDFLQIYKNKPVNFGFNGLGELVYKRTYSRMKDDTTNEEWHETVTRVVEGTYSLLL